jgi:hypothetical protein
MDVNRGIDDSIDNSEPLEPNPPRSEVLYHKSEEDLDSLRQVRGGFGSSTTSQKRIWIAYYKSEEDLDRLLQVKEGLANIHRRALDPADYSDFINKAILLPNGHHGLMVPPSWSGRPGHWKGMSPPSYPAQPTFLCLHLVWAGSGIGRARVLKATHLSPPFCAINLDNLSGLAPFQKGRTLDSSTATSPSLGHSATCRQLV